MYDLLLTRATCSCFVWRPDWRVDESIIKNVRVIILLLSNESLGETTKVIIVKC